MRQLTVGELMTELSKLPRTCLLAAEAHPWGEYKVVGVELLADGEALIRTETYGL